MIAVDSCWLRLIAVDLNWFWLIFFRLVFFTVSLCSLILADFNWLHSVDYSSFQFISAEAAECQLSVSGLYTEAWRLPFLSYQVEDKSLNNKLANFLPLEQPFIKSLFVAWYSHLVPISCKVFKHRIHHKKSRIRGDKASLDRCG